MKIEVRRFTDSGETTLSLIHIDGEWICFGLEDEERTTKVWGETRIPEGTYAIKYRTEGGHYEKYRNHKNDTIKNLHNQEGRGMLHVLSVPNFEYILIHIGNTDNDTAGCLLTGTVVDASNRERFSRSTEAYIKLYSIVAGALDRGEPVSITYSKIYEKVIPQA